MRPNIRIRNINHSIEQEWLTQTLDFINNGDRSKIERMVSQHREGQACKMIEYVQGAFKYCIRIRFVDDNQEWMLRFPKPGCAMQRTGKVYNEFAIMRFVSEHTTIPVPKAIACGVAVGELAWLGPYIIMEFVQGEPLNEIILDNTDKMKSEVSEATLSKIFRQIANILLQPSLHDFEKIGSLTMKEYEGKYSWFVEQGPLTIKSNEIENMSGVKSDRMMPSSPVQAASTKPESQGLMNEPFEHAQSYLEALADESLYYLTKNPMSSNTAEEAASDYTSIHILKKTVTKVYAASSKEQKHNLFNDDLRFGNILVDNDFDIVAVIDWEYAYSAPAVFTYTPPLWIIGREPFEWEDEDVEDYSKCLNMLIGFIKEAESSGGHEDTLSRNMQRCWEDGTFWLAVALRESRFLEEIMARAGDAGVLGAAAGLRVELRNGSKEFGERKMEERRRYEEEVLAGTDAQADVTADGSM